MAGGNATLIGEESAGSAEGPTAGHILLMTLPNSGLKVRIPNAWNCTNVAHFVQARGVPVDDLVTPTLADFEADADGVLEVAKGAPATAAPDLAQALAGEWVGALDYRDFGNDRRTILPTQMTGVAGGGGTAVALAFSFDDGPGKTIHSVERWSIGPDGKSLFIQDGADTEVMNIVERRGGTDVMALKLVAAGRGEDNGVPVSVRTILTRCGEQVCIARLTQRPGGPFILRDAYEFHRLP
jgi:hypothetical protein